MILSKRGRNIWEKIRRWEPLYWLRTHTINRYHIVDCRNDEYRWGWCDASELILYAPFAVLVRFMEKEFPGMVKWEPEVEKELWALYNWWKTGRRAHHDEISALFDKGHGGFYFTPCADRPGYQELHSRVKDQAAIDEWNRRNSEPEEKDQEMLLRLVKIRGQMWT